MQKRSFKAHKHEDKLVYASPKTFLNYKQTIKEGEACRITFEKWSDGHTDPQRKYYFGVVIPELIAQGGEAFQGYTKDELHVGLKARFLSDPERIVPKIPSLASLTVDEMSEYIDRIVQYAASEEGIIIPDAEETGE